VAAVGELTASIPGFDALKSMHRRMLLSDSGRKLLRTKPIIHTTTIDMERLSSLPQGTFGKEYHNFLSKEQVTPDTRAPVKFLDERSELAYVMLRYRQTHDFMHTLTAVPTTLEGELALKWFEFAQTGLPMTLLAGVFGPLRLLDTFKFQDPLGRKSNPENTSALSHFLDVHLPWAIQAGTEAKFLLNVPFEELFDKDLEELRQELNIIPFPQTN
jgi:ubiquinone biosynthesis protein COQ4